MTLKKLTHTDIKNELNAYLSGQDELKDFDFEGSAISKIVDVLSYNDLLMGYYEYINNRESWLSSAQNPRNYLRSATFLGYVPRSSRASKLDCDITVVGNTNSPATITLTTDTKFSATKDSKIYNFVPSQNYTAAKDVDDKYVFSGVRLVQGDFVLESFSVTGDSIQTYELSQDNVDTSNIDVHIRDSISSGSFVQFSESVDFFSENENVYFLDISQNGNYSLEFGDGFNAKKLDHGNAILVKYLTTSGESGNDIVNVYPITDVDGLSDITVLTNGKSYGGADIETLESIRFNAPKQFSSTGSVVNIDNYRYFILKEFPSVDDVKIWDANIGSGVFGYVYISAVDNKNKEISDELKIDIKKYLEGKNIGSVDVEFVEPNSIGVDMDIEVRHSGNIAENSLDTSINQILDEHFGDLKFGDDIFMTKINAKIDSISSDIESNKIDFSLTRNIEYFVNRTVDLDFTQSLINATLTGGDIKMISDGNEFVVYRNNVYIKNTGSFDASLGKINIPFNDVSLFGENDISVVCDISDDDILSTTNEIFYLGKIKTTFIIR